MTCHRNADGTYNGVTALSAITGLSQAEIRWTWDRLRHLIRAGKTKEEAKAIVKAEATFCPWEPMTERR